MGEQGGVIVEVLTDEGITGIGGMEANFGWGKVLLATIEHMIKPQFVGKDPFQTEYLIRILRGIALYSARPWLVENALWDIIGKACGQPLYKLWGGWRDKIKAYASWAELRTPEERGEDAVRLAEEGFRAVKMRIHDEQMKNDLALVEAVKKATGDRLEIMVDANQAAAPERPGDWPFLNPVWGFERAKATAKELERFGVAWLEEPLPRYDLQGLAKLAAEVDIPIAGGELNKGIHEFKWLLEQGCLDIIQPNCTFSEGMFQVRKIAALAEAYYKRCIPHAWTSGPGFFANLQVAASIPACEYIEYPYDPPAFMPESLQGTILEPLRIDREGYIHLPQKPGLGIELDREAMARYRVD